MNPRLNTPRRTKILATLGPQSNTKDKIRALVAAGASAFRLNFSHGSHADHAQRYAWVREIEAEVGYPIAILQDLQGPKIRIGEMAQPVTLCAGETFVLDADPTPGTAQRVALPHPEILPLLKVDDPIYINDGLVRLRVVARQGQAVQCLVVAGGAISSRKGVNLPQMEVPLPALTDKDRADLEFGLQLGVDWVALSFVQRPEDLTALRALVGDRVKVMVKIEMPAAVKRLDEIVPLADACMVARGDLGVELPLAEVPPIQKRIIRLAREQGKIVVVATQMLESMVTNIAPTRAEVSDVANATYEGADCLMLSAESANGAYPVEAVAMMDAVIRRVEQSSAWLPLMTARGLPTGGTEDAITGAASQLADSLGVGAIVTFTAGGTTALRMSRQRPQQPILAMTPQPLTARMLVLAWGVQPHLAPDVYDLERMVTNAADLAHTAGQVAAGQNIVVTAGLPIGTPGSTNMLRVVRV